jgi:hypothetical protein
MLSQFWKGINKKSFIITMLVVLAFIMFAEWVIHGHLLKGIYTETGSLWRTDEQMKSMGIWMIVGYVLLAKYFTFIYARGCEKGGVGEGLRFGVLAGLLLSSGTFMWYVILPITLPLLWYWVAATMFESIVAGMIAGAIYKKA